MHTQRSPEIDELAARVGAALAPLSDVRVAYLFGSRATGRARAESDLDVAVAFPGGLSDLERGRLKLRIIEALTATLGALGERADVVDLGRVGSALAFGAIRDGICVVSRAAAERVRLEATVARRYDDDRPHRELFRVAAQSAGRRMAGGHGRT